jgi:cytoskeletal protein CcmA (bactofilin family)
LIFRKRQQSLEIIIGPQSSVMGSLSTPGIARIDGNVEGNVTADWLIIGEAGCMKGDVVSRGTTVAGRLEGSIRANESVDIGSKGIVAGDIYTTKLSISEGACFDGHSYMRRLAELDGREVLSFQKGGKPSLGTIAESGGFDEP